MLQNDSTWNMTMNQFPFLDFAKEIMAKMDEK